VTHRWGEDLDRGLARVVADDLAILVPATQVRTFPWRDSAPMDYRVSIDVQRFERTSDGAVVLEARWAVHREDEATAVIRRSARIVEEVGSSDYAAAAGAMSRAAARLSQEIAAAIRGGSPPGGRRRLRVLLLSIGDGRYRDQPCLSKEIGGCGWPMKLRLSSSGAKPARPGEPARAGREP
jgi:hypothetical protein